MKKKDLTELIKKLHPSEYSTDSEVLKKHCADWRGEYHGKSKLIIFPRSVKKISEILSFCQKKTISVVPQGGNTGLVGGGVPRSNGNEIIINLSNLNKIRNIDLVGNSVTVEGGCILDTIKNKLEKYDLEFPLSMGSRGSCQIGGNIATNAGGLNVIKYGTIRQNILGIEAVLPDGRIYSSLKNVKKNNTGLDLKHLLIGSEGTLGIVTAATVQLFPLPKEKTVLWASFKNFSKVLNFYKYINNKFKDLITSFEFMNKESIEVLEKHECKVFNLKKNQCYCLVEFSNFNKISDFNDFIFSKIDFKNLDTDDLIVSKSESENKKLWSYRESIPLAERKEDFIIPHDISIPLTNISEFVKKTTTSIKEFLIGSKIINFGHLGDNNLHFNVLIKKQKNLSRESICKSINKIVFDNVKIFGGAISAEHGIGQLRKLELKRNKEVFELNKMRDIKKIFDPHNILNPGKIF